MNPTGGWGEELPTAGPTYWPSLTPTQAERAWDDLRDWVEQLVDRFSLDPRIVPPCWFRHNAMVEALVALRDHEQASYAPSATKTQAIDWLRALREVEYRLTECAGRTQCSVTEHRADQPRLWHTAESDWQDFVSRDLDARDIARIPDTVSDR